MPPAITAFDALTCLGDAEETYAALLRGRTGVSALREDRGDRARLGVGYAYQIDENAVPGRASDWLGRVVAGAAWRAGLHTGLRAGPRAGLQTGPKRVAAVIGTGLRELPTVERWSQDGIDLALHELHFAAVVRDALPGVTEVLTLSNACSAGGYALAVGSDLLAAGEADAVVVAGCDAMTESMLAIIGRGSTAVTEAVRPFDAQRTGVLLGEGAAAVVLEPAETAGAPLALLRGVGLSCDAYHETAPDLAGIVAGMCDAHQRAGIVPADVDLVLTHGTGTALNDPVEAAALAQVFGSAAGRAAVTGIKGATGHTSGAAALMSLIVAVQALRDGRVPAIAGLRSPIAEAAGLDLVVTGPRPLDGTLAQVNAFGFGGVNAVSMVEVPACRS